MKVNPNKIFSNENILNRMIDLTRKELKSINRFNIIKKSKVKAKLQALEEGARDILTPSIANQAFNVSEEIDKNNYKIYGSQVDAAYKMYDARSDYGGELVKGLVESRVALIAGEGLSVNSTNKTKLKWIEDFLNANRLHGSRLMDFITIGELEGKCLAIMKKGKDKLQTDPTRQDTILIRPWEWQYYKYTVNVDPFDRDEIKDISYQEKKDFSEVKKVPINKAVYVKLDGARMDTNLTSNRLHCVLTQIENYSRALYDLRNNTHVFGKYMPYWKTQTGAEAKAINADVNSGDWVVGTGYAGTADFSIVEPSGAASNAILSDMLAGLRVISMMLSIPIHFLAHPELMSNRATADNLYEVVINGTRKPRLIWEEKFHEMIQKAMMLAVDSGIADNAILKGDFQIKLPIISISLLKQIIEVWHPLLTDNLISEFTFRNMLPNINPMEEDKLVSKEKEKRMEESPFQGATNPLLNNNDQEKLKGEENDNQRS